MKIDLSSNKSKYILIIVLILSAYLISCTLYKLYETHLSIKCGMNLKAIGSHFPAYRLKHKGQNPETLKQLIESSDLPMTKLCCPGEKCNNSKISYVYIGQNLDQDTPMHMILAYEKNPNHRLGSKENILQRIFYFLSYNRTAQKGRNVLFANGTVRFMNEKDFAETLNRAEERQIFKEPTECKPLF